MPIPLIAGAAGLVGSWVVRGLAFGVIRWVATKALWLFLIVKVVPWVLNGVLNGALPFISASLGSALGHFTAEPALVSLTELGAYFGGLLRLDDCFSVLTSALIVKGMIFVAKHAFTPTVS